MLCPPGPVTLGFSWCAKAGDDYMNYRLDTEEQIGETSVLAIRREGRYTVSVSGESCRSGGSVNVTRTEAVKDAVRTTPMVIERRGVTLFAWNRGVVLEDRFLDRVLFAGGRMACSVGATHQAVTRLIRSQPEDRVGGGSLILKAY
jgi:hypothetical protein